MINGAVVVNPIDLFHADFLAVPLEYLVQRCIIVLAIVHFLLPVIPGLLTLVMVL